MLHDAGGAPNDEADPAGEPITVMDALHHALDAMKAVVDRPYEAGDTGASSPMLHEAGGAEEEDVQQHQQQHQNPLLYLALVNSPELAPVRLRVNYALKMLKGSLFVGEAGSNAGKESSCDPMLHIADGTKCGTRQRSRRKKC